MDSAIFCRLHYLNIDRQIMSQAQAVVIGAVAGSICSCTGDPGSSSRALHTSSFVSLFDINKSPHILQLSNSDCIKGIRTQISKAL